MAAQPNFQLLSQHLIAASHEIALVPNMPNLQPQYAAAMAQQAQQHAAAMAHQEALLTQIQRHAAAVIQRLDALQEG